MGHHKRTKRFGRPTGRHTVANRRLRQQKLRQMSAAKKQCVKETFFSCLTKNNTGPYCKLVIRRISEPATADRDGYRVVHLPTLNMYLKEVTRHTLTCSNAKAYIESGRDCIKMIGATRDSGIACTLTAYCLACAQRLSMETSPKVSLNGEKHYDVNVRAVWGQMSSGGGAAKLRETHNTMGMPGMSSNLFTKLENLIGNQWEVKSNEDMHLAAAEERAHAINIGSMHEGVPAISVVCDGGWSKRSHKHTYDALGGVAVIIGAHTKKLLHIGVRTKTCATCTTANTRESTPNEHVCFRNWDLSSQAMEADIILEGFNTCEEKYGLRYTKIIADGDSSTFATLLLNGPSWCSHLQKVECSNHTVKCLRGNLEKLVAEKPQYKGKDKLTKTVRERLCRFVRYAIRLRSSSDQRTSAICLLKQDILGSLDHAFGVHIRCHPDVCLVKKEDVSNSNLQGISENQHKQTQRVHSDVDKTVQRNINAWRDATGEDEVDIMLARGGRPGGAVDVCGEMRHDIMFLLNRLVDKTDRLIGNFTTNLAENWMSIRSKFDGGKFVNRCQGGSWQARCYGAVLRKNLGPDWSAKVWEENDAPLDGSLFVHQQQPAPFRQLRSRREVSAVKFLGRRVRHKWVIDELNNITAWYEGTVLRLLSGADGKPGAEYEVLYDGEDDRHLVDHLLEDYQEDSLILL